MRFYVANNEEVDRANEEKEIGSDSDEERITAAKLFNDKIVKAAGIGDNTGDVVASLKELPFIIPRGKYSLDLFP